MRAARDVPNVSAASPPAHGWYVYALVLPGNLVPPEGMDGESPVTLLASRGIGAAASVVPLAEFGSEPLRRNLQDVGWLEEKVRRHERVVEALLARGPVLPLRFGTVFLGIERLRAVLAKNARTLREALRYVAGKEEWGLKGFSHRVSLRTALLRGDPAIFAQGAAATGASPGHRFFALRKAEELLAARSLEREVELADDAVAAVVPRVARLVRNPIAAEFAPEGERVVLNLACLLDRRAVEPFLEEAERWNRDHRHDGFRLTASGPWPPYHFTPGLPVDA
ncbi:MAG: GvpL/GvpF family gas vesicle protein [Gemmatimonadetes bacterium]|nr:GvpL/GvpF family gas vesicle protein [Gemmatimonadota bacterium]